jgi:endoglucanase
MYCILNLHYDGKGGAWLNEGIGAKDKFINIWTQISNEFKEYDEYLIFESMNDIENYENYVNIHALNQAFIDKVRNSGGKNGDRLLIIAGIKKDFVKTCNYYYKIPVDPSNKIAISIHYYNPVFFATEPDDNPWSYYDNGKKVILTPITKWGEEVDYKNMFTDFQTMKAVFIDKKIPIVITETGVLTQQQKEIQSIRDYLYFVYLLSAVSDGIIACLFDNSNSGDMRYYDREQKKWYDETIEENFKKIARGEFINPTNLFSFQI